MKTPRGLLTALFSLTLTLSLTGGCGSIEVNKPDGAAGSSAGGSSGAGGAAGTGAAGRGGAGGTDATGRGGSDGPGNGGRGGAGGNSGNAGAAGRGGAAGGGAGRGGASGAAGTGAAGRGGAAGTGAAGRGGAAGTGAAGRGGAAGTGAAGRGGNGGAGGGSCICQTLIKPVCGVDGKTYDNDCQAACVNVAVAYQGTCVKECQSNADCIHYADGVGDCCGACLPTTAPKPPTISCLLPCQTPITCPCVVGKCLATSAGATTQ